MPGSKTNAHVYSPSVSHTRLRLPHLFLELPPPGPGGAGRRLELTPDLRALLLELPEQEALAGVYHHVDGMSHEEIAPLLGVSRRTVGNLLVRFGQLARLRFGPDDDAEVDA